MRLGDFIWRLWYRFRNARLRKQLLFLGIAWAIFLIVTPLITYAFFARDIKDPERLMNRNNTGVVILDRHGETVYSSGRKTSVERLELSEISDDLEQALIASEDKDFYQHQGFSPKGILGAIYGNVANKDLKKYGGSTITQQLVKNNLLSTQKTFLRKYQELSVAIAVDRHYSKDDILEMYLNSVYFGEGTFGIEEAARTYFNKSPNELNLAESSMLVAILPAPSANSPISGDKGRAQIQQARVLQKMLDAGYITEDEKTAATTTPLAYAETKTTAQSHAQHFTQMVLAELTKRYGEERTKRSGLTVTTGLDLKWQEEAERILKEQIDRSKSLGATNGALLAIDPRNGEIRTLVGSSDWEDTDHGQVNMTTTPRQPGSSFKPIYYTEALAKRHITAATILRDESKDFNGYKPRNFDNRFRGDVTARNALATSLNIPAIEVIRKVGLSETAAIAYKMGIKGITEPEGYGLSLALGTAETTLLDMTNAYAAFARNGEQFSPTMIVSIRDKFQKVIYTNRPTGRTVQTKEASYVISSILSDNKARAPLFGNSLTIGSRPVAVKTGTTDENKDAWTIGYTPSLVTGVWVGDNTHKPMNIGGSQGAGPIWRRSMQAFLENSPVEQFTMPNNIEKVTVCNVAGTYQEIFIRGTAPTTRCEAPRPVEAKPPTPEKEEVNVNEADTPSGSPPPPSPTPEPEPTPPPPSPTPEPEPTPPPPTPPPTE